ncbi:MAG: hypothetical protein N2444_06320, partial [Methylocystis sp.]|nr:hypothetical protein [Methylocystis sp.]
MSAVLGVAWAVMIAWMLLSHLVTPLIPSMVAAGMMSAAALTLNIFPIAAFAFIAPIALGGALGLAKLGTADGYAAMALLASYCYVLWNSVAVSFNAFITRTLHQYELSEQADTVSLLLHDFQEHSADWLWTVDERGRLGDISQRFAQAAQRPAEILAGR